MYIHEETQAGDTIIVRNHYSGRYHKKGMKRSANKEKTSEAQEKANARKDAWELTIRLNANFHPGDYWLTFDYKPEHRPETIAQAKKDRTDLLRRLRRLYKKYGKELKFIAVTEYGEKGALHHHIVMNAAVSYTKVCECWPYGKTHSKLLENEREYSHIAGYIVKYRKKWKEKGGKGRMWTCSKNLVRPPTRKWIVRSNHYYENPRARKGYYVTEVSSGTTEDGWPYQNYILVRSKGGRAP